jgi:hypothetical protein
LLSGLFGTFGDWNGLKSNILGNEISIKSHDLSLDLNLDLKASELYDRTFDLSEGISKSNYWTGTPTC